MRTLAGGLVLAAVMLTGFSANQSLHLGQSALAADAVAPHLVMDRQAPTVAVKVTNRTGQEALLVGWLGSQVATAVVPARSAIVELSWGSAKGESAHLRLRLYPDAGASPRISDATEPEQSEDHMVVLRWKGNYSPPPTTAPPTTAPPTTAPPTTAPPTTAPPTTAPPTASVSPSPSLPVTGASGWSFVRAGSGLLGFGAVIFGLAWIIGRRRRDSATGL